MEEYNTFKGAGQISTTTNNFIQQYLTLHFVNTKLTALLECLDYTHCNEHHLSE